MTRRGPRPIFLAGAIGLAAVAAGVAWYSWTWLQRAPLRAAQAEVLARLKDPDSAKFTGVTVNPTKGTACGYVNAKNSMGGYTGSTHFILFADGDLRFAPSSDRSGSLDQKLEQVQAELNYAHLVEGYCTLPK